MKGLVAEVQRGIMLKNGADLCVIDKSINIDHAAVIEIKFPEKKI